MASTDATPLPIKNQALQITRHLWLTTGLINSGAAGLDSEISKDNGAFADCTNEATEIGSSGSYTLDLTSTEMDADVVVIQIKSSTTNAITDKLTIYPSSLGKMQVDVRSFLGTLLTETAGQIAAGFKKFFNIAAPASTMDALTLVATATNLTNAPTNGDLTAVMKTSVTTAATAATPNLNAAYDAAKTAAQAGDEMDLVNAPNATAVTAIQSGLSTLDTGDIPTAVENADALLKRDWTSVTGEAARSVLNALRFLRNKWSLSGSTLTVTKEDDSTSAWTAAVSTDAAAVPVVGSDPT